MRTILFLQLVLAVTTVWAGGYQGALERVWLYYAYEIDGLNDPADRTLGFACKKWVAANAECLGDVWSQCKGAVLPSKRCTLNEFIATLGSGLQRSEKNVGGLDADGQPLPQDSSTPGVEETATNLYNKYKEKTKKSIVPNYHPYQAMLHGTDNYNEYLDHVADVVTKAASKKTSSNQALFEGFKATNTAIIDARIGDHGPFIIKEAQEKLQGTGITVATRPVGSGVNPADGTTWETVDWKETISQAVADGMSESEATQKVNKVVNDFYGVPGSSQEKHKTVITFFRDMDSKLVGCLA